MADYRTSIEIEADPGDVFDYLVTEEGLTAWLGQHAALDVRPGGEFAVDVAGHAIRGRYLEVEPQHRVLISWGMTGSPDLPPGASTVEFTLTPIAHGTRVDLVHAHLPDHRLDGHADGWTHFLSRLRIVSSGGEAGDDDWVPIEDRAPQTHPSCRSITMTPTTDRASLDTVLAYHEAWTSGDIDLAMNHVADDIVCRAPGGDLVGKNAYRGFLAGFAQKLIGLTDVASFADGEHVALFYYPHTATTSTAPAAEYFTVSDGHIAENLLVFDRSSFGPPSQQEPRRSR